MEPYLYMCYAILRLETAGLEEQNALSQKLRKPSDQRSAI